MQVDAVCHGAQPISTLRIDFAPGDNPFARVLEPHECIAHLTEHGRVTGHGIRLDQDALDPVVLRRALHVGEEVVETGGRLGVHTSQTKREGGHFHTPLHERRIEGEVEHGAFFNVDPEIKVGFDTLSGLCEGRGQATHEGTYKNENEKGAGHDEGDRGAEKAGEELLSEVHCCTFDGHKGRTPRTDRNATSVGASNPTFVQ